MRMSVSKLRSIAAWASGIPNDFPRMVLFWALESLGFIGGLEKVQVSDVSKFLLVVPSISWVSLVLKVVAYFHPQIDYYLFGISSLLLMVFAFFFRQTKRKPTPYSLQIAFVGMPMFARISSQNWRKLMLFLSIRRRGVGCQQCC